MKKIKIYFSFLLLSILTSCTNEEKLAGTIEGNNLDLNTLQGVISSTVNFALTDQEIPVTITLPRTFSDVVTVEVTSTSDTGRRRRSYIEIPANTNTIIGNATSAGGSGGVFINTNCTFELSAISLKTIELGKHYLLSSNKLSIGTGNSSIPAINSTKLQIKLSWLFPSSGDNNLNMLIDRPNIFNYTSTTSNSLARVITVPSTSNLLVGMLVKVVSGTGVFASNTIVESITSPTTFVVNINPITVLNDAIIEGFGNDFNATNSFSTLRIITVPSTLGLAKGMVVAVTSGGGKFAGNTTVFDINSPTTFTVSTNPLVALTNATISASYPDALAPIVSESRVHDISVIDNKNTVNISSPDGEYILKIAPLTLLAGTVDLPYRLIIVKPSGDVEIFNGVYTNINLNSTFKNIIKINKTTNGTNVVFTATNLNP